MIRVIDQCVDREEEAALRGTLVGKFSNDVKYNYISWPLVLVYVWLCVCQSEFATICGNIGRNKCYTDSDNKDVLALLLLYYESHSIQPVYCVWKRQ